MTYVYTILANTTANIQDAFFSNDANKILAACVVVLAIVVVFFWRKIESLQTKLLDSEKQRADLAERSIAVMESLQDKLEPTRRK